MFMDERVVPRHVAVIMDGNGRWAKARGLERWEGHRQGGVAVGWVGEGGGELGVRYLTLYAFSRENWSRPTREVEVLMGLMVDAIAAEEEALMRQGVEVRAIGNLADLPGEVRGKLEGLMERTRGNGRLTLVLALSYGSKWEIVEAAKRLARDYAGGKVADLEAFGEADFAGYLGTAGIPDPDLLIRTSGECRLSNFLLWQSAYAEYIICDILWPDFKPQDLEDALDEFSRRQRRFGGV